MPTHPTPSVGARSPAPFSPPPARRRRAPAASGSFARRSSRASFRSVPDFALPWLLSPSDPLPPVRVGLLADLVQELVQRLADTLEPSGLRHRQVWIGDVPARCRNLVTDDPVLHRRAVNPRPSLAIGEQQVQVVGNLRREVVDVGVPVAI